jgi:hypothetical protein
VFDGLTANRRSCMECGYTVAIIQLAASRTQDVCECPYPLFTHNYSPLNSLPFSSASK